MVGKLKFKFTSGGTFSHILQAECEDTRNHIVLCACTKALNKYLGLTELFAQKFLDAECGRH